MMYIYESENIAIRKGRNARRRGKKRRRKTFYMLYWYPWGRQKYRSRIGAINGAIVHATAFNWTSDILRLTALKSKPEEK